MKSAKTPQPDIISKSENGSRETKGSPKPHAQKSAEIQKIHFKGEPKEEFLTTVRKRVDKYFRTTKTPKTASSIVHLKSILLIISCTLIYLTLLNNWLPAIPRIFIWLAFGLNQALIAVNIGHDSLHGSYSSSPLFNRLLGFLSYDCIGLSSYVWKQTHNLEHHTFTNIAGVDPDINKPGLLRLSPHDPHYPIHKFQHLYIWLLYALISLNWILYSDYLKVWEMRKVIPRKELFYFIFFKFINLSLTLIIPLFFFPMAWWQVLLGYTVFQMAGGLSVAIIFQLAHLVENVDFPLPDEQGIIWASWGAHEMATTSNFATKSPFVTHIVGGLNFQIEHHLMPKISHCRYFEISKIVRATAKEYGLPYHEQPTTRAAIFSHAKFLKNLGQKPK